MFDSLKSLFVKAVELPSSFFKSEIVFEEPSKTSKYAPSEIQIDKKLPRIKQMKEKLKKT